MRFEIRRLHEASHHDPLRHPQTSGSHGHLRSRRGSASRPGRAGRGPEDLFRRPRTRFVAEFIGRPTLVDGQVAEPGVAARGTLRLRLASARPGPGDAAGRLDPAGTEIELVLAARRAAGANTLAGAVQRTSYLGTRSTTMWG